MKEKRELEVKEETSALEEDPPMLQDEWVPEETRVATAASKEEKAPEWGEEDLSKKQQLAPLEGTAQEQQPEIGELLCIGLDGGRWYCTALLLV